MTQPIDFQENTTNGQSLHFRHWKLANARAVVCIVHGLGEHIGRYEHVAVFFAEKGIATLGFDHQGHGHSSGKRGHSLGFPSMMTDVKMLVEKAKSEYPGLPVFLYGHSMGGCIAVNFALTHKPAIAGLVATAPLIQFPVPPPTIKVWFGKLMSRVLPALTLPNGLDVNGLSNDPAVVKAYQADPLVHDRISARLGTDLIAGARFLDGFSGTMPFPTLLTHGGNDPITSPAGSAAFAERNQKDVTWKRWEGLKHEIHNEPQQGEVLGFLVEWMGRFI